MMCQAPPKSTRHPLVRDSFAQDPSKLFHQTSIPSENDKVPTPVPETAEEKAAYGPFARHRVHVGLSRPHFHDNDHYTLHTHPANAPRTGAPAPRRGTAAGTVSEGEGLALAARVEATPMNYMTVVRNLMAESLKEQKVNAVLKERFGVCVCVCDCVCVSVCLCGYACIRCVCVCMCVSMFVGVHGRRKAIRACSSIQNHRLMSLRKMMVEVCGGECVRVFVCLCLCVVVVSDDVVIIMCIGIVVFGMSVH